ncbi:MAG: extracellular solute-binding protein [Nocardioidaceae bacterium]|nr:extracellular solute-binding protein [Nocardioidaceae bacterium]
MRSHSTRLRVAPLVAVATAALALSGCSAGSLGGSSGSDDKTLTFLSPNDDASVASGKALIAAFEKANPGVTVKMEQRPGGSDGDNIIKTRLSTGDMDDVFVYNNGSLLQAIKPATNLVPLDDQSWAGNIDKLFADSSTVDGKLYGGPVGTAFGGGVLYNIPIYKMLHLQVPKTWDEFMSNSAAIKKAGKVPIEQTYGETWTSQLFVLGDYHNVAAQVPDFASQYTAGKDKYASTPAALAGFEHLQQVKEAGYLNKDYASATLNDGLKAVADGTAAQYPQLGGSAAAFDQVAPGKGDDVGFFALPGDDAASNGMTVWPGTSALYIPKTTEGDKLDLAKKFIAFATTQKGCEAYAEGSPPQGPFLSNDCKLPSDVSQVAKDTQAYFSAGKASPALEFLSPIKGPNLEQICVQVGTGQVNAEKGAQLYDDDVEKQAQQLGLPGWS